MKRAILGWLSVVLVVVLAGCVTQHGRRPWACMGGSCAQAPENCQSCTEATAGESIDPGVASGRPGLCRGCFGRGCLSCRGGQEVQQAGPPTGTVTYPYYTTRGPRDFLAKNPPSIGP